MLGFDYRKAVQCLNYFAIQEGGTINKMKAIKLIWLADRKHLRTYARPVVFDEYFAMKNGPVQTSVKDLAENTSFLAKEESEYRNRYIDLQQYDLIAKDAMEDSVFSETDLSALSDIYAEFGQLDQFELVNVSHRYPEWKKFEQQIEEGAGSRFLMDYLDFFSNPDDGQEDYFASDAGDLELTKGIFFEEQIATRG